MPAAPKMSFIELEVAAAAGLATEEEVGMVAGWRDETEPALSVLMLECEFTKAVLALRVESGI